MTVDEVRALRKGSYVASKHDNPAYRIRRISLDPWINEDGTVARISLASYRGGEWVSPEGFIVAPGPETKYRWCNVSHAFVPRSTPSLRTP